MVAFAYVAFVIEFDNEFEERIAGGGRPPVVLTSMVMWENFLRFVGDGISAGELTARAGVSTHAVHPSLPGMERWCYVVARPDPADTRAKPPKRDWIVRPTPAGVRASTIWAPLAATVEAQWRERAGVDVFERLRAALALAAAPFDGNVPRAVPVVGTGMRTELPNRRRAEASENDDGLAALLARVLIGFTIEYERESSVSLPIAANVLRVLEHGEARVRDIPQRAGVAKEGVAMALTALSNAEHVDVVAASGGAGKVVRITDRGRDALTAHGALVARLEEQWAAAAGGSDEALRAALASFDLTPGAVAAQAPPGGWRQKVKPAATLPHHPMVLHRGGWPDGS